MKLGLGCWQLGGPLTIGGNAFGYELKEDPQIILRSAFENGITFFDTADFYGLGQSERELSIFSANEDIFIATKGGIRTNGEVVYTDFSCEYLKECLVASLERLKRKQIDIFYIHGSPKDRDGLPLINDMLGSLKAKGLIRHGGFSVGADLSLITEISRLTHVDYIQAHYNLLFRQVEIYWDTFRQNKVSFVASSSLSRGLLGNHFDESRGFDDGDARCRWDKEELRLRIEHRNHTITGNDYLKESITFLKTNSSVNKFLVGCSCSQQIKENASLML